TRLRRTRARQRADGGRGIVYRQRLDREDWCRMWTALEEEAVHGDRGDCRGREQDRERIARAAQHETQHGEMQCRTIEVLFVVGGSSLTSGPVTHFFSPLQCRVCSRRTPRARAARSLPAHSLPAVWSRNRAAGGP